MGMMKKVERMFSYTVNYLPKSSKTNCTFGIVSLDGLIVIYPKPFVPLLTPKNVAIKYQYLKGKCLEIFENQYETS